MAGGAGRRRLQEGEEEGREEEEKKKGQVVVLVLVLVPQLGQAAEPGLSALGTLWAAAHQLAAAQVLVLVLVLAATPDPEPDPASRRPTRRYSSRKRDISLGYSFSSPPSLSPLPLFFSPVSYCL